MKNFAGSSSKWAQSVFPEITTIRVLIVADGSLNFLHEADGLGLTQLRDVLRTNARPWETVTVITAHRSNPNVGADIAPFFFNRRDNQTGELFFTIKNFEQVWLFGYESQGATASLSQTELKIVSDFMEAGGGVFATGDHQDLGFALCGELPRVRSMRKWSFESVSPLKAPDRNGPTRIDTLRTGSTPGFQRKDQEDITPQEIFPKYFIDATATQAYPHSLLANGDFPITILPDHMHEGMCVIPQNLEATFAFDGDEPRDEYPFITGTPARVSPVRVAAAVSASGYIINEDDVKIFPVEPSCFTVITAYDGHYIKPVSNNEEIALGRVVADASFHHFVNLNLDGFLENGVPSPALEIIRKYFVNIRKWLSPANVQRDSHLNLLLAIRYSALIEEIQPTTGFDMEETLRVGRITQQAIAEFLSPAEARECTLSLTALLPPETKDALSETINPWIQDALRGPGTAAFLDSHAMSSAILGSAMLGISAGAPESPFEERPPNQQLRDVMQRAAAGVKRGLARVSEALSESVNRIGVLSDGALRDGLLSKGLTTSSLEEINIMARCRANSDNPWISTVNSATDGEITIGAAGDDGTFRGRHHKLGQELSGQCFEASGNEPDKIFFAVPRTSPRYLYVGVISVSGNQTRIDGRRYTFGMFFTPEEQARRGFVADEVWVAVKTT